MVKFTKKILTFLLLLPFVLTSCNDNGTYLTENDPGTATIRIYKDNNSSSKERYLAPKNVKLKYTYNDLSGILSNNENVCPSIGNVNLLVIPVHLPGGVYNTEEVRNDIKTAFFSKDSDRIGFKSLSEYYYESSFGQLNFQGEVTDWFVASEYTNIKTLNQITQGDNGTIVQEILKKAVVWAETIQNIDLTKYDQNQDGSIDAIWLVYDHLDMESEYLIKKSQDNNYDGSDINTAFWNVTSWDWSTEPNLQTPTTSGFSWSSFSMMYSTYCEYTKSGAPDFSDLSKIPLDTHTYIHETGHLLGLDDYYANDDDKYHPMGKATMMDQNICDLDSYSKMLLGWVTPYVVYGRSEILIPTATSSKNSVIVIPTNYDEISSLVEQVINQNKTDDFIYEFNPFSEYIMIDLYSPDGLNVQDTYGPYLNNRVNDNLQYYSTEVKGIDATGVRIYHVDSRIFKSKVVNYDGGVVLVYDEDNYEWDGRLLNDNETILMPISNQKIEYSSFQLPEEFDYFDQIRLLEASQNNTFSYDGCANENTLFTTKTKDFNIGEFGYQFFNSNYRFNNGNELPFRINIKTLKEVK